ncbi:hypothetical protein N7530_004219 [Penicillium desertorum]|uniref:Uncharacterized protein n=1 Tax=Penicillium desertorum TaxID=1303715 RepID=A0A9W9WXW1_9EURO|nr:hypothetical protein N7530_004219 [Penicillium desertorum]
MVPWDENGQGQFSKGSERRSMTLEGSIWRKSRYRAQLEYNRASAKTSEAVIPASHSSVIPPFPTSARPLPVCYSVQNGLDSQDTISP